MFIDISSPEIYTLFISYFFFFNDTATTEIYTLSLHDALPIFVGSRAPPLHVPLVRPSFPLVQMMPPANLQAASLCRRSEEHTSELQSRQYLVCRLLLEKKKTALQSPNSSAYILFHVNEMHSIL